eukprot:gb/GFBE01024925.1/.p1 GENE.gb/GFBE01024925.1/~~gb/GFBE01024925.1/.p1  ORF type:complete len:664 (+),score=137.47 gb/GFBE01024925.1/:1-1992(+)
MRPSQSAAALILGGSNPALVGTTGLKKSSLDGLKSLTRPSSAGGRPTPRKALSASLKPGIMRTVVFSFTNGGHGMDWEGLIITEVSGQARELGVQVGWRLYQVDGVVVKDGKEVWERLQDAKWQWRTVQVVFCTDFRAIRAEQKLIAAEEEQAEVERLATLPFSNTHDEKHLAQLKEEFTFQGYIARVEDRAITLPQLQRCVEFSKARCHRWRDQAPATVSRTSGRKLHIDWMNWCHLHDWLVSPVCKAKNCSLVEMLTSTEQPPAFYLVHWWGDLIGNVLATMKAHINARQLPEDTKYWMAFGAIRPHVTQELIQSDPKNTRFFQGMSAAGFKVVLALDPKTDHTQMGTCFNRLWCLYELSMCLGQQSTQLDIMQRGKREKGTLVTQFLTQEEKDSELRAVGSGYKAKADREKYMGFQIMDHAVNVSFPSAQITDPRQRQKMLNAWARRDPKAEVLERHDNYTKLVTQLRSLFALAFWRRTMSGAVSDSEMQHRQTKLLEVIKADTTLKTLDLDMAFMQGGPDKVKLLATTGLPPSLQELKLDLRETELVDESLPLLAGGLPREMEDITLNLSGNDTISNAGIEGFMSKLPAKMKGMELNLNKTAVSKDFKERQSNLDGMKKQIADEAAKADRCTIYSLCPSPTRHMIQTITKTKLPPPPEK